MNQPCSVCKGQKIVAPGGQAQLCPNCQGTGVEYDPGLFFVYGITINLNGNQALQNQFITVNDRPFRWMFAAATSTGAFTSLVKASRDKRPFTNAQVLNSAFWGTAQLPMPVIVPFVFLATEQILIDITDISGGANRVDLSFIGVELDNQ